MTGKHCILGNEWQLTLCEQSRRGTANNSSLYPLGVRGKRGCFFSPLQNVLEYTLVPTLQNVNTHLSAVEVAPLFVGDNINVLVSTFGCGMSALLDTLPTMSVGLTFQRTVFTVFAIHCPLSDFA